MRKEDLERSLSISELMVGLEDYLKGRDRTREVTPRRIIENMGGGVWLFMPAHVEGYGIAIKTVNEYTHGAYGLVELYDEKYGWPLAIMDAPELTKLRTGALGGVAVKYMARSGSGIIGVIGSGRQAEGQLEATVAVIRPSDIIVYSRSVNRREEFARRMGERFHVSVHPIDNPNDVVRRADVLLVATNSTEPVLDGRLLPSGSHVNSVGVLPERRELDDRTFMRASCVVFDTSEGALREAGDVITAIRDGALAEDKIVGELEDVVKGKVGCRSRGDEITVFKSVGFAALDVVAARIIYEEAKKRGLGVISPVT